MHLSQRKVQVKTAIMTKKFDLMTIGISAIALLALYATLVL